MSNMSTTSLGGYGGGFGSVLSTNGMGGGGNLTWSTTSTTTVVPSSAAALEVRGDATINGSLIVNDSKLNDVLSKIESRLAILHPNVELEGRWQELKELRDRYHQLESEIIEMEKTWSILKK